MTKEFEGKHSIEINHVGDGRIFLNHWDNIGGEDVTCELKDGKLFLIEWNEECKEVNIEVTLPQFIEKVKQSIIKSEKE